MSKLDKDQVITEFTAAYTAAFGKAPVIEQKPGWFSVDGGKNIRLAELAELGASYSKTATAKPATAKTAAAKPAATKTPVKKSPAAAKPNKAAAAAFWAAKVGNPKQRPPRGSR
ncbi:hypothetical protein [Arsukibacterium sp.]|uniref:hypothetical protein n=1 Tax=Arsukibacterium sp. TaxID=1977258 RepID=UPI002FD92645